MARLLLVAAALGVVVWVLLALVVTSATARVKEQTLELIEAAKAGGPEAAERILAALADDYRGTSHSREEVERAIRGYVGGRQVRGLRAPRLTSESSGDEISVRVLLYVELTDASVFRWLHVLFAKRGDDYRIVDVRSAE